MFRKSPLQSSLHQPTKLLARVAIDILAVYLKRLMEVNMLLLLVIFFSKLKEVYAVSDHTALTVADKLAS